MQDYVMNLIEKSSQLDQTAQLECYGTGKFLK